MCERVQRDFRCNSQTIFELRLMVVALAFLRQPFPMIYSTLEQLEANISFENEIETKHAVTSTRNIEQAACNPRNSSSFVFIRTIAEVRNRRSHEARILRLD